MISFQKAFQSIQEHTQDYGSEIVEFSHAENRILAESIYADRDFPPFDRSTRDGIAINSNALKAGKKVFKIAGISAAGSPQLELNNENECLEIMTGAILPVNADTVIMYEHLRKEKDSFVLEKEAVSGQNIHYQASDIELGGKVMGSGIRITAAEIGVIASVGKVKLQVRKNPTIAVISTGDELVDVTETPLPYQIRKSNSHSLKSLLKKEGIEADLFHLMDNPSVLEKKIKQLIQEYDVLLLSGGVSKGKYDFLPEIFDKLGVEKVFHRVLQRPGKPFWFGKHKEEKTLLFAFPGNPVSTFVNYHVHFKPWLNKTLGLDAVGISVFLKHPLENKTDLTFFKGVRVVFENGTLWAEEVQTTGSGDVAGLTKINGFVRLKPESKVTEGELLPFIPTRKTM
ncbi:MAG: molybdopterin molybdotransferase MoeA [Bacteroidota bacterium]